MKRIILIAFSYAITNLPAMAQKLANVQEIAMRAPAGIRIDGKAAEWNSQLLTYNKAVDITYAIANDDENLYLLMQAAKPRIIEKIIDVGVTFIINSDPKKRDNNSESMVITYPTLEVPIGQRILWYAGAKAKPNLPLPLLKNAPVDTVKYSIKHVDSLTAVANNLFFLNAKDIKVRNLNGIAEWSVSVYNQQQIKAVALFNNSGVYTYELAIPLKRLKFDIENPAEFSYSIRLDSRLTELKSGTVTRFVYPNGVLHDLDQDLDAATSLWGTYTLVKSKNGIR